MTATTDIEPDVDSDVEATVAEDAVDEVASDEPAKQQRWPLIRRVLLGALIVALLGGSGFLGWQAWQEHRVEVASRDGQAAAVRYAQVLTSIDSNNVDQNFADVLNGATGEFKDMYSQSSAQLRQLLLDNKATAHGVVIDSAVKSATPTRWSY